MDSILSLYGAGAMRQQSAPGNAFENLLSGIAVMTRSISFVVIILYFCVVGASVEIYTTTKLKH